MSSALSGLVNQTAGYLLSGNVPGRMGNEHPSIYPYEPFPTPAAGIAIGNDRQFRTLCTRSAPLSSRRTRGLPRHTTATHQPRGSAADPDTAARGPGAAEWFEC